MTETNERPFADLPAALVQEVLDRTQSVSSELLGSFDTLRNEKQQWLTQLSQANLLRHESDLEYVPIPTSCGTDGSYAVERLLATDLVAAAAVAVEGVTPPSENRFWPEPRHQVWIETEGHCDATGSIARAVAIGMELCLAVQAPHEVIFLDGSLTTPTIFFNQGVNRAIAHPELKISHYLFERLPEFLSAYRTILRAQRTDKAWIAIPKYTTRREIGKRLQWANTIDDRAALTYILQPGSFTRAMPLEKPEQPWHIALPAKLQASSSLVDEIERLLDEIHILYYRPYPWLPAIRVEMGRAVAETTGRLALSIHAIKHQCGAAAMMEPYPLYMADRMVKSLARAIPTFRQITSQRMAEAYQGDISDIFLGLHGYRTESGRG